MAKTEKYLEGLTIHKVPYNIANTLDFKTNVMGKAADNELFIITDTPTFSLKIGNVTYDGTSNVSATTATQSASGLMSAADKKKLDGIAEGATKITVDTALSSTSTNPVQNKAVNTALNGKASTAVATTSANGLMSSSDKSKLDGIADGANKTIIDSSLSTTSTNPVQNKVINTALSGKASTSVATTSANGLMSASDKIKLNGIATGANKTTVDSALSTTSTNPVQNKVVKDALDSKLNTSGGTLTGNLTGKYITGTWLQTTAATDLGSTPGKVAVLDGSGWVYYRTPAEIKSDIGADAVVTTSSNGLMSASDKSKLDGIAAGANKTTVDTSLSSTSTNPVQNKVVNSAINNLNTIVTFHGRWNETDNSIVFSSTSTPYDDIQALLAAGKTPKLSIQNDYGDWEAKFYLSRDGDGQYQFFSYEYMMDGTPLLGCIHVFDDNSARWSSIDLDNKLDCSGGTMTGQLTLNSTLILRSATYGDTLPSSGVAGQVFFKKV